MNSASRRGRRDILALGGLLLLLMAAACQTKDARPPVVSSTYAPVVAESDDDRAFQRPREAYGLGKYELSRSICESLLDRGYVLANNLLALHYEFGRGASEDIKKAVELFRAGHAAGDPLAAVGLAKLYRRGKGVERDYEKARELYREGADAGIPSSMVALAGMYRLGQGGAREPARAQELYRLAFATVEQRAASEDLQHTHLLAHHYLSGIGTTRDADRAEKLFEQAAEKGYVPSMDWLARAYFRGRYVTRDMETSRMWSERSAASGSRLGQINTALRYLKKGPQRNEAKAADLLRKSADQGFSLATIQLTVLLLTAEEIDRDPVEAAQYLKIEADKGFLPAMGMYGLLLESGIGVPRDDAAVFRLYSRAAEKNYATVYHRLGTMYLYGRGTEADPVEAIRFFEKALPKMKPGKARVTTRWNREIAINRLSAEQVETLQAEGLLAGVAPGKRSTSDSLRDETAEVVRRLSRSDKSKLSALVEDSVRHGLVTLPSGKGGARALQAQLKYDSGDLKGALDDADAAIRSGNDNAIVYVLRSAIHIKLGNNADARSDLTTAIRKEPRNQRFYVLRANASAKIGTPEALLEAYLDVRKAYEIDPTNREYAPLFRSLGLVSDVEQEKT